MPLPLSFSTKPNDATGMVLASKSTSFGLNATLTACIPFDQCVQGGTLDLKFFNFDFNNTGIATFNLNGPNGQFYNVIGEKFTVTPEPTSALLFATGLLVFGLVLPRRH